MRFRRAEVIPGIKELGLIQISPVGELKPNSQVVVKGAFYLLSEEKAAGDDEE
jgi:cobalt-zinc-cadmium efflux system membrane fusion protein